MIRKWLTLFMAKKVRHTWSGFCLPIKLDCLGRHLGSAFGLWMTAANQTCSTTDHDPVLTSSWESCHLPGYHFCLFPCPLSTPYCSLFPTSTENSGCCASHTLDPRGLVDGAQIPSLPKRATPAFLSAEVTPCGYRSPYKAPSAWNSKPQMEHKIWIFPQNVWYIPNHTRNPTTSVFV